MGGGGGGGGGGRGCGGEERISGICTMLQYSLLLIYGMQSSHLTEAIVAAAQCWHGQQYSGLECHQCMSTRHFCTSKCPRIKPIRLWNYHCVLGMIMSIVAGKLASGLRAGIDDVIHIMTEFYEKCVGD